MAMASKTWSWMEDVLPFVVMMIMMCLDMSVMTIVKAAMNEGMDSIVYIVYHNALGTLVLLPFLLVHIFRNVSRPSLSFHLLLRFFILGLLWICLCQVFLYVGINYSSPTMASAIGNLSPAITFLIAVIFRMEKVDIRSSSSQAKLIGTIIAISGAMVFALYQGPEILKTILSPETPNQLLLSQPSNWVYGGLILVISGICGASWNVLQTATAREYPDRLTIVFFFCLFGTISCIPLSLFLEPNLSAWVLQPGIKMIAVVWGAVYSVAIRGVAATWCLEKKGPVFVAMFSPLSIVIAVIMGVTFLGDSLYLGSAIGAAIVAAGFYTVMWGHAKENNKLPMEMEEDLNVADGPESSNQNTPLLSSWNESKC
ncbi:WAT1-related protein At5g40240-like [Cynara cardunculus var. scolymus]|uniref:WAT1-related protein At5g40240-like n=1 Tax=Cynara cardunculus var. scolymus TaxID=59895 RepID=UPI000D627CFC|nr:WAT1-related protein At5g40240-like [Cynara cardunculus var. scolymus]